MFAPPHTTTMSQSSSECFWGHVIINYTGMRVCCSLYISPQALGNSISVEYLLTKQTIARRQEWANKDISANNINNYNINSVTHLIHFLTLYFQQHWWDYYLEYLVLLGRNNFLTYGVEIRKLEITCMSSDDIMTDFVLFTHLPKINWYQVTTPGVVWELFVSRIRLPTSLSIPKSHHMTHDSPIHGLCIIVMTERCRGLSLRSVSGHGDGIGAAVEY